VNHASARRNRRRVVPAVSSRIAQDHTDPLACG
jgi:hypothetical protein